MNDAEFTELLRARGLACLAENATLEQLRARYGVRRWYEFSDVIDVGPVRLFEECRKPFYVAVTEPELLPPDQFLCDFDALGDGTKNHDLALGRFINLFGRCTPQIFGNGLGHVWTFGQMSLRILTFLKGRALGVNPLYQRFPELWNITKITITRNWTPPITGEERRIVASAPRFAAPTGASVNSTPSGVSRGFFRRHETSTGTPGFWQTEDGSRIGWSTSEVSCFLDSKWVKALRLERLLPARGGGGSSIALQLMYPFQRIPAETTLLAMSMGKPNDCDDFVKELAAFWGGLPITEHEWLDD